MCWKRLDFTSSLPRIARSSSGLDSADGSRVRIEAGVGQNDRDRKRMAREIFKEKREVGDASESSGVYM
jgi:hypothetical protein